MNRRGRRLPCEYSSCEAFSLAESYESLDSDSVGHADHRLVVFHGGPFEHQVALDA